MKKNKFIFTLFLGIFFLISLDSCVKDRIEPQVVTSGVIPLVNKTLIHYWNFNDVSNLLTPTSSIGTASIEIGGVYDDVTPGTSLNVRNPNDSATALRVRNPSTTMILNVPTTGYKDVVFSFAVMRTGSGPQSNIITYTVDGTNYLSQGLSFNTITVMESWVAYSIDFSSIEGADNNEDFAIKFTFDLGNTNATGNDRYDNITIDASPL